MNSHELLNLPDAPAWSLAIGHLGRGMIWAAIASFFASVILSMLSRRRPTLEPFARMAFGIGTLGLFGAFACVVSLFVTDQFQFKYVFLHGARDHELQYKIAGAWAGQEGSFLLWAVTSAIFCLLAAPKTGAYRRVFTGVCAAFLMGLAGILAYESPFALQPLFEGRMIVPPDGRGLAPSLLNYWVVIHPPTIFLGFGSLTVLFAWAVAALARKDLDSWIQPVRPWAIVSTTLLGLGLCMGGFWAYETLGWGGFWMWDPVENTSFVPWCAVVAFLHGVFVQVVRGKWKYANALLAALPFITFCYGTFLTRSGFLADTSVHSFAQMNRTALWILVGFGGSAIVGFAALWLVRVWQARREAPPRPEPLLSRGWAYGGTVGLMLALALATGFGMSVPMVLALAGREPKVVEEGLYHNILVWIFVPIMLLLAVGPMLGWRKLGFRQLLAKLNTTLAVSIFLVGWVLVWALHPEYGVKPDPHRSLPLPWGLSIPWVPWMAFLTWLCLFAIVTNGWRAIEQFRRRPVGAGSYLAHLGLAITLMGLVFSRGFERKEQIAITQTKPARALDYAVSYKGETEDITKRHNKVLLDVKSSRERFVAKPGLYYTIGDDGSPNPMVWPSVGFFWTHDVYVTLHPISFEASEPTPFTKGETRRFEDVMLTFEGLRREGEMGQPGTRFVADFTVEGPSGKTKIAPSLRIGERGLERETAPARKDLQVSLERIDANTGAVFIQLGTTEPIYPIEVFYKPLTGLVWLGVGIMTLGGGLAAWNRRRPPRKRGLDDDEPGELDLRTQDEDAPLATAQS